MDPYSGTFLIAFTCLQPLVSSALYGGATTPRDNDCMPTEKSLKPKTTLCTHLYLSWLEMNFCLFVNCIAITT